MQPVSPTTLCFPRTPRCSNTLLIPPKEVHESFWSHDTLSHDGPWRPFGSVLICQCQVYISDHKSPQHRFPGQTPPSFYVPQRFWAKWSFFLESFFLEPTMVHPRRGNVTWVWSLHPTALHLGRTQGQMSNLPGLAVHTGRPQRHCNPVQITATKQQLQ